MTTAEAELRQYLANDSVAARRLDRDDDDDDDEVGSNDDRTSFATDDDTKATTNSIISDSTTRSHTVPPLASASRGRLNGGPPGGSSSDVVNTGPKGVREDARAFEAARDADDRDRRRNATLAAAEAERASGHTWSEERMISEQRDRWVEKRLKELSKQRGNYGAASVGKLTRVDANEYLEVVENCAEVCVLVIDVDGDDDGESDEIAETLALVARRYPGQKFVSLDCAEAEMDAVVCPALLHYAEGELVNDLMRIIDEIPTGDKVDRASLERVLLDNGFLANKHRLDGSRE